MQIGSFGMVYLPNYFHSEQVGLEIIRKQIYEDDNN